MVSVRVPSWSVPHRSTVAAPSFRGANGLVCLRHFHGAANPQVSTADQEQNHQQYAG